LEPRQPRLNPRSDSDSDQQAEAIKDQVEEIRVSLHERHHLADLADDAQRKTTQDQHPDGAPRTTDSQPQYRQHEEDAGVDNLVYIRRRPKKGTIFNLAHDETRSPAKSKNRHRPNNGRQRAKKMESAVANRSGLRCAI